MNQRDRLLKTATLLGTVSLIVIAGWLVVGSRGAHVGGAHPDVLQGDQPAIFVVLPGRRRIKLSACKLQPVSDACIAAASGAPSGQIRRATTVTIDPQHCCSDSLVIWLAGPRKARRVAAQRTSTGSWTAAAPASAGAWALVVDEIAAPDAGAATGKTARAGSRRRYVLPLKTAGGQNSAQPAARKPVTP